MFRRRRTPSVGVSPPRLCSTIPIPAFVGIMKIVVSRVLKGGITDNIIDSAEPQPRQHPPKQLPHKLSFYTKPQLRVSPLPLQLQLQRSGLIRVPPRPLETYRQGECYNVRAQTRRMAVRQNLQAEGGGWVCNVRTAQDR